MTFVWFSTHILQGIHIQHFDVDSFRHLMIFVMILPIAFI